VALTYTQSGIDGERVFADEMGDDGLALADRLAIVEDVGKLAAWRRRRIDALVRKRHAARILRQRGGRLTEPIMHRRDQPQERKHFQAVAVVVGNAEQRGIRIEDDHWWGPSMPSGAAARRARHNLQRW
jgi:hypothetical protein